MSQNDDAVLTAAVGYVFTAPVGTARPSPAELKTLDPSTYGSQVQTVKLTGAPTGGTFVLTVGTSTAAIAYNASPDAVKAALELLAAVGAGNAQVTGVSLTDTNGFDIAWIGAKSATSQTITGTATLTGGTTPALAVTLKAPSSLWNSVGHTSRGDLPEFGFDGGDHEVKGTWQNESLREIVTSPIADFLTLMLHQFDQNSFELYYGTDSASTAGVFGVGNGNVTPVEKALLVLIVDGTNRVGFYAPKASVRRDDSVTLATDDFATLPVKATFLKQAGVNNKFEWVSADLFA